MIRSACLVIFVLVQIIATASVVKSDENVSGITSSRALRVMKGVGEWLIDYLGPKITKDFVFYVVTQLWEATKRLLITHF